MDFNLIFIGVVLFMLNLLPTWSGSIRRNHHKTTVQQRGPCIGGKWFQVGSFRFWQRAKCFRRQAGGSLTDKTTKLVTAPPGVLALEDIPSLEAGPQRGALYDPSYGYEMYWADGEWLYDKRPDVRKEDNTTKCGYQCSDIYKEYGTICARNRHDVYKTFDNYCHLRNADCRGYDRWLVLYRGKCYRELMKYERNYAITRAEEHIKSYMSRHPNYSIYVGVVKNGKKKK